MITRTPPRPKLREQVAERIKRLIADEGLEPGDRLPTESQLAERIGVSRLSVREATKALEFLGIVAAKTGVGLAVGQLDLAQVTGHLGFLPALHRVDAVELIDTRVIIETGALPHVARRMAHDPALYDQLRERVERFRSARDLPTWIARDLEFHRALLEASGLSPLLAFGDLLQVFFQRFRESVKRAEWKQGIESHQRVIDGLRSGDVSAATRELKNHIESHKGRIKSIRPPTPRRGPRSRTVAEEPLP